MSTQAVFFDAPPRGRSHSFKICATFVLLAALSVSVAFTPHLGVVVVSAVYLGSFFAYLGLRPEPSGDAFEIVGLVSVITFIYFCVGTYYLVAVPDALLQKSLAPFLLPSLMLATLGHICFLVGYAWSFRNTAPSPMGRYVPSNILFCIVPTAIGSVGMMVAKFQLQLFRRSGGISAGLSFLQQFSGLFFFGWFLAWYLLWAKKLTRTNAVALLASTTAMTLLVLYYTLGSKSMAFTIMAMPMIAFYAVKRRFPWKTGLSILLLFVFLVFPMYNTFRRVDHKLDTTMRVDRAVDMAQGWDSAEFLNESVFAVLDRISIVTSVAAIISETGRWVDYKYGETLFLAPIAVMIPRFLWPDKPNVSLGREFGATFRFTSTFDRETYIAPSMVGEFYWNFAVPGVVLGMWLLGMSFRWYYQRYGAGSGFDPIRKATYALLLPVAIGIEGNFAMLFGGFVKSLVIIAVFVSISRRLGWLNLRTET